VKSVPLSQTESRGDSLWRSIASAAQTRGDFVRMACVLEASAPKVGNVHPSASFNDLRFADFVIAADRTAEAFADLTPEQGIGDAIQAAVNASVAGTQTNVNLGIVLLLGPLISGEPDWQQVSDQTFEAKMATWQFNVAQGVRELDGKQGAAIAAAIAGAGAGGLREKSLGDDHPLDVTRTNAPSYDILAAMRIAAPRDRIAKQYADGFDDLFTVVVPTLREHVARCGDLFTGIVHAHIALIAATGDSLIARKCGPAESQRVAALAQECLDVINEARSSESVSASICRLDAFLRSDGNRLNPGTTADLIAAAIYVVSRASTVTGQRP